MAGWIVVEAGWSGCSRQAGGEDPKNKSKKGTKIRQGISTREVKASK